MTVARCPSAALAFARSPATSFALPAIWLVACAAGGSTGDAADAGESPDATTGDAMPEASAPEAASGDAGGCAAGQTRCDGDQVETCEANGAWGNPVSCALGTCMAGQCSGVCTPGATRCSAGNVAQTCNAMAQWTSQTCPVACCNGACIDTTSDPNNCGACGDACGAGYACGLSFSAFTGTMPSGWSANGSATYDTADSAAQMTGVNVGEVGTWIRVNPVLVDVATFQFDFFVGGGTGADGMGFMLETEGAQAVGGGGGGLGMSGLTGFGVELDSYDNNACLDTTANHVGIDSLAPCGMGTPNTLAVNNAPGFTVADGAWHTMVVKLVHGAFTVTAAGIGQFSTYTPAGWADGKYYVGFGGGNGGSTDYHRVRNVQVQFQTPHCF